MKYSTKIVEIELEKRNNTTWSYLGRDEVAPSN